MTKLVLVHKVGSIYEDEPDKVYDFPKSYLRAVKEAIGNWVIYYEPVKAGPRGYFAVAKIDKIIPKPRQEGRYLALIEAGTFLPFDQDVPRMPEGRPLESVLADENGAPKKGGAVQLAVRRLPDAEFEKIASIGLPSNLEDVEATLYDQSPKAFQEAAEPFHRPVVERLSRRPYRDVAFRRKVRSAYDFRCAMSGLHLRNGGGRPEVQAAHIRPVEHAGSDAVRNGLALSGTLHWMFDRGLVSVASDMTILVSKNKVPSDVIDRLLQPDGKLLVPQNERDWPHPENLRWHRENIFGQFDPDQSPQW